MTLDIRQDRRYIRSANRSTRHLLVRLVAPAGGRRAERLPLTTALVLDRSGSMSGPKIALAKEAADRALGALDDRDRFAVVVYDDQIDVVAGLATGSREAKDRARERLATIDARGTTNLAGGWLSGCEQAALGQDADRVVRTLLLTDGLANVGITDPAELERHAGELRRRGVATSTFGVGADFDEALLQAMAAAGGGHFYYIERPAQIPDLIASELGEALDVVARSARLEIELPSGVDARVIGPRPLLRSGDRWTVELGDLVSRQELEVLLALNFPHGADGREMPVRVTAGDADGALAGGAAEVRWVYADHRTNDLQTRDRGLDRTVASLHAARARQEAVALNRAGDFAGASRLLRAVAQRIRGYAGDDPNLLELAVALEREAEVEFSVPMAEPARKARYSASYAVMASRDVLGRARRADPSDEA
jgi:Ca-activated chloride channel homolog